MVICIYDQTYEYLRKSARQNVPNCQSGGNLVDRIHAENIGCEYGEYSGE
jgi:hypothetical protein